MRVGPAASMAERSAPCGVRVLHPQSNPSTMDSRTVVGMAASALDLCRISDISSTDQVTELAAVSRLDGDRLVTAVRTATGGRLQLVVWRVQQPSGAITRLADSGTQAGVATSIDIARGAFHVTAFR